MPKKVQYTYEELQALLELCITNLLWQVNGWKEVTIAYISFWKVIAYNTRRNVSQEVMVKSCFVV